MSEAIIEEMRGDVIQRLPRLLEKAMVAYTALSLSEAPENAKEFAAFQANCRAALTHVHLLIKLAEWARKADQPKASGELSDSIEALISEAEAALQGYVSHA
jgi:hypothetical protein